MGSTPARDAEIRAIKQEVKVAIRAELANRVDAATGQEVLHFESDQLITLDPDPTREWRFSELRTEIEEGEQEILAFLNLPMRALPSTAGSKLAVPGTDNSQLLHAEHILPLRG